MSFVLVFTIAARPANAFLDAIAVVGQLASLVTQLGAVKGAVENQRDQFRMAMFGKIAPMASGLKVVNCFISGVVRVNLGFDNCQDDDTDGIGYHTPDGQTVLDHIPFNRTAEICAPGMPASALCYEEPVPAVEFEEAAAACNAERGCSRRHRRAAGRDIREPHGSPPCRCRWRDADRRGVARLPAAAGGRPRRPE